MPVRGSVISMGVPGSSGGSGFVMDGISTLWNAVFGASSPDIPEVTRSLLYDDLVKVVIVGDPGVGKSSLVQSFSPAGVKFFDECAISAQQRAELEHFNTCVDNAASIDTDCRQFILTQKLSLLEDLHSNSPPHYAAATNATTSHENEVHRINEPPRLSHSTSSLHSRTDESDSLMQLHTRYIMHQDRIIKFQIWDTQFQSTEKYKSIMQCTLSSVNAVFIIVDVSRPDCLNSVTHWTKQIRKNAENCSMIALICNKCEITQWAVSTTQVVEIATKEKILYGFVSAKQGRNISELFGLLAHGDSNAQRHLQVVPPESEANRRSPQKNNTKIPLAAGDVGNSPVPAIPGESPAITPVEPLEDTDTIELSISLPILELSIPTPLESNKPSQSTPIAVIPPPEPVPFSPPSRRRRLKNIFSSLAPSPKNIFSPKSKS